MKMKYFLSVANSHSLYRMWEGFWRYGTWRTRYLRKHRRMISGEVSTRQTKQNKTEITIKKPQDGWPFIQLTQFLTYIAILIRSLHSLMELLNWSTNASNWETLQSRGWDCLAGCTGLASCLIAWLYFITHSIIISGRCCFGSWALRLPQQLWEKMMESFWMNIEKKKTEFTIYPLPHHWEWWTHYFKTWNIAASSSNKPLRIHLFYETVRIWSGTSFATWDQEVEWYWVLNWT